MKSVLIALALMLSPMAANAAGKLQLGGNYRMDNKDFRPSVGLGIYEKLADGVAFNSWTGAGESAETGNFWAVGKYGFDFYISKVTLGAGVQFDMDHNKDIQDSLFVKVEYRLWD